MTTHPLARHRARILLFTALAIVLGMILCAPGAGAQSSGIRVGAQAPGAIVETLDGKQADLSQYVGKQPVLIEFWATWCGNCRQLEPAIHAAAEKYKGKVAFVGVAVSVNQSPERVRLYAEKHKLPLTVFYDRKGHASDAYDVAATSYIVVVNKAGKVVYTGLGGDQDIDAAVAKALQ